MKWPWTHEKQEPINKKPDASTETISAMVYWALESRLTYFSGVRLWISGNYDAASWEPRFADMSRRIDSIREWALTLQKGVTRTQYLRWLDHYEHGIENAREELTGQRHKRQMDALYADWARQNAEMKTMSIPKPPDGKRT